MVSGFSYCAEHVLSSTPALSDYQVKILVHYGTGTNSGEDIYCNEHCRGDFEDVAFEDSVGADLPYWRETYTEYGYAIFWVRMPTIDAATTLVIKYGNPEAVTASNPTATFLFYDQFPGTVLDVTKWSGGVGSISTTLNDYLRITDASDAWIENSSDAGSQIHSTWVPTTNCKVVWKSKIHLGAAGEVGQGGVAFVDGSHNIIAANLHTDPDADVIASGCYGCIDTATYDFNGGSNDDVRVFTLSKVGTAYTLKHQIYGSSIWINEICQTCSTAPTHLTIAAGKQTGVAYCNYVQIDWIYVRNYTATEPSHGAWTAEELLFTTFESRYVIKPEPSVDPTRIIFYHSLSTSGGDIDVSHIQVSSVLGNEFGRITAAERTAGTIKYTKQFIRNENDMEWGPLKVYLSSMTQYAPNTSISFALTGSKSFIDASAVLSGTATTTATGYFATSVDLRNEVRPGEQIYNSTDDTVAKATKIKEVASTYIQLDRAYIGTIGAGKTLSVAPATMAQFIAPATSDDVLCPAVTIGEMEYIGMWKRYIVQPGCPPFSNDWFTIRYEEV